MNDNFYYGRRQIIKYDKTGQPSYTYLPLTEADFLDPQPGDEFAHGDQHDQDVRRLRRIFQHLYRYNPLIGVFSQLKLDSHVEGEPQPAPDLMVVPNITEPDRPRTVLDVVAEETRPRFVLEVCSPRLAALDLARKAAIYQQAGVAEYFIVDAGLRETASSPVDKNTAACHYTITGYRLEQGAYVALTPEADGRIFSKTNKVWIGATPAGDDFIVVDQRTGEPVVPDAEYEDSPAAAHAESTFRAQSIASQLDFLRP
ncbi:MAG: Uma2 family endonuclease [Chloroflexi bacterium]|nr:Uma2 family endonuclease [Chloroflexota bacterium]